MAELTGTAPIKRGIVRRTRSSANLTAAFVGGIHQRLAPRKIAYPFFTYDEVSAPFVRDWGTAEGPGREIKALYDLTVWAKNMVDAENILQLVHTQFDDAESEMTLLVDGHRVTLCSIIGTHPDNGPERDDTGAPYARAGLTLEIWTEQPV
jgi:hypothetical protein